LVIRKSIHYPLRWLAHQELNRRCRRNRAIVLTYDDGPGSRLTRSVVDLLGSYDARATFFLLGRRIEEGREAVELAHRAGHDLGVHTFDHGHAWKLSSRAAIEDIDRGYEAAAAWVPPDGLFRPPHGKVSLATWRAVRKRGARICWWTVDSGDTWPTLPPVERSAELILRAGGGVVLMHDFDREPERDVFVLKTTERLLEVARKEGYRVMTLSELFGRPDE
jgi:peptidoglycan/xylan/chitin deacetylase (PgdA/CDA1 family)